jgi:hypothetical protein
VAQTPVVVIPLGRYTGIAGLKLGVDELDLGHGVSLSKTYAHIVSKPKINFTPKKGPAHLGPWTIPKSWFFGVPAGWSRDIAAQLYVPDEAATNSHSPDEISAWIIQLLSFQIDSHLAIAYYAETPIGRGGEIRMFSEEFLPLQQMEISIDQVNWVRANWRESMMLIEDPAFLFAFQTFFSHHLIQSDELRIVSAWAVLERIFSSKSTELRFRVSANLAAFLEPHGPKRRELFRSALKLYDERSAAAHGSALKTPDAQARSMRLARRALTKLIEQRHVPTAEELEQLLFG